MKLTCPNCRVEFEHKSPARVAHGKAMAANLTAKQRSNFGKLGGWPKGKKRKTTT